MINEIDFDPGMPTPCSHCGKTVDFNDMRHPVNCTRCEGFGSCDNYLCDECAEGYEAADDDIPGIG